MEYRLGQFVWHHDDDPERVEPGRIESIRADDRHGNEVAEVRWITRRQTYRTPDLRPLTDTERARWRQQLSARETWYLALSGRTGRAIDAGDTYGRPEPLGLLRSSPTGSHADLWAAGATAGAMAISAAACPPEESAYDCVRYKGRTILERTAEFERLDPIIDLHTFPRSEWRCEAAAYLLAHLAMLLSEMATLTDLARLTTMLDTTTLPPTPAPLARAVYVMRAALDWADLPDATTVYRLGASIFGAATAPTIYPHELTPPF
ncbi:hypothetical protein [Streptomyces sp. NPDC049879]|uniref:hypothetical protein n=1 Tax=Streptomyces sp. NPDC049879 TaxID=3365598 RepID=UPI0037BABFF8